MEVREFEHELIESG